MIVGGAIRAGAFAALVTVVSGCAATAPAPSAAELKTQNKAFVVFGGRIANRFGEEACAKSTVDIVTKNPAGGEFRETLVSQPVFGTQTRLFTREVAAGSYALEKFQCYRAGKREKTKYSATAGKTIATFSVEGGETADLGVLAFYSSAVNGKYETFGASSDYFLMALIDDTPNEFKASLSQNVVNQLKPRHMVSVQSIPAQEIANRCAEQRKALSKLSSPLGAPNDPPICRRVELAGKAQ